MINKPAMRELLGKVDCRYALVVAVSKRARQLVEKQPPLTDDANEKPISQSVEELNQGKYVYRPNYPIE